MNIRLLDDDIMFAHNRRDKGDTNRVYTESNTPGTARIRYRH